MCAAIQDLAKAREGFVLTSDMHLTYLVTPVDLTAWDRRGPDWGIFYKMLQALKVWLAFDSSAPYAYCQRQRYNK